MSRDGKGSGRSDRTFPSPRRPVDGEVPRGAILFVLAVWAIALGYLEGSVVVYLREVFYKGGFRFPLVLIPPRLYWIEFLREVSTILLLWGVAWLSARDGLRRFGAFAFCFGVWDIVYYLMLKGTLGWPASVLDWDILFLIPLPWTGPVLAPILISLALIGAGATLVLSRRPDPVRVQPADWAVETVSGLAIIGAFLWNVPVVLRQAAPESFPWWLLLLGVGTGTGWFAFRWVGRPVVEARREGLSPAGTVLRSLRPRTRRSKTRPRAG